MTRFLPILLPFAWLLAGIAAVYGVRNELLWPEIGAGWGVVALNALIATLIPRWVRDTDLTKRAFKTLSGQVVRAFLLGATIFLAFRLDFFDFAAFLAASLAGYLMWLAGHVLTLHHHSLRGNEPNGHRKPSSSR